jgi:thiamine-monophosphate kinase
MSRSVADLGEWGLIDLIASRIGPPPEGEIWSGDDAAVVQSPGDPLVVTTDVLVEGVDFDFTYCPAQDVGWKAMTVNVSDVAAMGGAPRHAVAALSLRPDTSVVDIESLLDGFLGAGEDYGISVVGGDVSTATEISISVTVIGSLPSGRAVRRDTALGGDAICVTGELGGAAGGLIALKNKPSGGHGTGWDVGAELDEALDKLAARQLRPTARLPESRALMAMDPTAMIDISDGLVGDLGHILDASGVGCRLEPDAIPVDENLEVLKELVADLDPLELALTGGEDLELIVTLDPARVGEARMAVEHMGTSFTRIGTVMTGPERYFGEEPLAQWKGKSWEHLRGR